MNSSRALLFFLTTILLSLGAKCSFAQKVWTLKECVDYALLHNISIKQSEISTELSHVNYVQNATNMLPSVNGSISHTYNY